MKYNLSTLSELSSWGQVLALGLSFHCLTPIYTNHQNVNRISVVDGFLQPYKEIQQATSGNKATKEKFFVFDFLACFWREIKPLITSTIGTPQRKTDKLTL